MIDKVNMSDAAVTIYEELIYYNSSGIPILYEPNEFEGRTLTSPPEFVIKKNGITFWIKMRELPEIEKENAAGESGAQIRGSLAESAGAFGWDTDKNNINLIAMEMSRANRHIINIGQAVFGDEVFKYGRFGKREWHREKNGFFDDPDFCSKVAGVIIVKSKDRFLISKNAKLLLINDKFKNRLEQIRLVMDFDRVVRFNDLMVESQNWES